MATGLKRSDSLGARGRTSTHEGEARGGFTHLYEKPRDMNGAYMFAAFGWTTMTTPLRRERSVLMVRDIMQSGSLFDIATCMY